MGQKTKLEQLKSISKDMVWCWLPVFAELFRQLDEVLWKQTHHNAFLFLNKIDQKKATILLDGTLSALYSKAIGEYENYYDQKTWYEGLSRPITDKIAYFSAEFGIHESLQIYCGGLGILAGDHLKSSSDLGIPLVGIGLMYSQGYFHQSIDAKGWQRESYETKVYQSLPFELQFDRSGKPLTVEVMLKQKAVTLRVWKLQVGRIELFLLDSDFEANGEDVREITRHLYGGDTHIRIQQELILGVGGKRLLNKLGVVPTVFHMNEGHSAFVSLERMSEFLKNGKSWDDAIDIVRSSSVFTTHTPVPAGNDWFNPADLMPYLSEYQKQFGLTEQQFLALGRESEKSLNQDFCMTILAIHFAAYRNGVSALHGEVSREMWQGIWKGKTGKEVPIDSITNGIHLSTWLSVEMKTLLDQYFEPNWQNRLYSPDVWRQVEGIPDELIWKTHEVLKNKLISYARSHYVDQLKRNGATEKEVAAVKNILDPKALTIGFARRFATYKRATLLFEDVARLKKIMSNANRPIQFLFAGKAHPKDEGGKKLIQHVFEMSNDPAFKNKVLFLENYDIDVGRHLVQGVDLWLNNPERPMEASGTSGMKLICNGGLNFSISDGWWAEGYAPELGFLIDSFDDLEESERRQKESESLYETLENKILPAFFDRKAGIPVAWMQMVKESMKHLSAEFSTGRMVQDYFNKGYAAKKVFV